MARDDEVVLLDFWTSPYALRVRIALAEKGVAYQHKEENLWDKSPLLLNSNPVHKKIPVLIHNGKPVAESLIILQYIDEVWSDRCPLLPKDPQQRANVRFWADFFEKKIDASGSMTWRVKGEAQVAAKNEFIAQLKLLEEELAENPFFGGETFGYMDIVFISFASWFYSYEKSANFSIEEECPRLMAWKKRCMERESVLKHLPEPEKIYEYMCSIKNKWKME
ncbi:glutathione S-transferase U24-like [Phoenix dactylifera]|uniref:Probable glutathione S-transferase GSTU1 n=1 Tax=Phoenix dactylifera TaxID=42345 RepID=A0A8B8ZF36_PHODC|nr:glutathione S-transferase U24-like [Phoenix dactylifera]